MDLLPSFLLVYGKFDQNKIKNLMAKNHPIYIILLLSYLLCLPAVPEQDLFLQPPGEQRFLGHKELASLLAG
jgi:hypothetical protein